MLSDSGVVPVLSLRSGGAAGSVLSLFSTVAFPGSVCFVSFAPALYASAAGQPAKHAKVIMAIVKVYAPVVFVLVRPGNLVLA